MYDRNQNLKQRENFYLATISLASLIKKVSSIIS